MREKILIVEDSKIYSQTLGNSLLQRGFGVVVVDTVRDSHEYLRAEVFDYVLLDLNLPDGIGEDVIDKIDIKNTKIIVLSSVSDGERREILFSKGILDYVSKDNPYGYVISQIDKIIENQKINKEKTILVIDEDIYVNTKIEEHFKRNSFSVLLCDSPKNAISILKENKIDLIVLCSEGNEKDEKTLLYEIRTKKSLIDLPVIVISEISDNNMISELLKHGANDFLHNPFSIEHLILKSQNLIRLSDLKSEIEVFNEKLIRAAYYDKLTNVFNRNKYDEVITYEIHRAKRYKQNLSLILMDIDYFKKVNDNYGHDIGDSVLVEFSKIIFESKRDVDFFFRWGGEEFILLLPETSLEDANNLAIRLKEKVEMTTFTGVRRKVTVSMGISHIRADDENSSLLKRADEALYRAKEKGRNRVEIETYLDEDLVFF